MDDHYSLYFELKELPPGLNKVLRLNRWKRSELYKEIYGICHRMVLGKTPQNPLTKFTLAFTRITIKPLDLDGLTASFKPFLDSLVLSGVIKDDNWDLVNFDNTKYIQTKVRKKTEQLISVEVKAAF